MSFVQRKPIKSFNQTRGIYDVFEYKPDNGDLLEDMLSDGYFDQSRYFSDPDWNGGVIKAIDAAGYEAMIVVDASGSPVTSVLQKIKNQSYDISRYEVIDSLAALPKPVGNVITLGAGKAYKIVGDVDLMGNRLVASGRAENITVQSLVQIQNGDFIEIFVENNTAVQNVVVTDLNVTIQ